MLRLNVLVSGVEYQTSNARVSRLCNVSEHGLQAFEQGADTHRAMLSE